MKRLLLLIVLIVTIVFDCNAQDKSKVIFDFSGIEAFIDLCETPNVDTVKIDQMLSLPAYQGMIDWLTENWWSDLDEAAFRNIFRAVFIPTKYTIEERYNRFKRVIKHIQWAKENYCDLRNYIAAIKPGLNSQKVIERTKAFLPKDIPDGSFPVYFVVGLTQGSASEKGTFIDSEYKLLEGDPDKYLLPWISHELHHTWREKLPTEEDVVDSVYTGIEYAFYWLETEGIAEMVGFTENDLDEYVEHEAERKSKGEKVSYRIQNYLDVNKHLKNLNDAVKRIFTGNYDNPVDDVVVTLVPPNSNNVYHEVGHKMAYIIDKTLGRDALIKCVGKPKEFILAYQQSAERINNPEKVYIFDKDVMAGIKAIQWK